MAVLIGLFLAGCSVVVFEDSTACSAQRACPVGTVSTAPSVESASPNEPASDGLDSDAQPINKELSKGPTEEELESLPGSVEEDKNKAHSQVEASLSDMPGMQEFFRKAKELEQSYIEEVRSSTKSSLDDLLRQIPTDFEETHPGLKGFQEDRQFARRMQNKEMVSSRSF